MGCTVKISLSKLEDFLEIRVGNSYWNRGSLIDKFDHKLHFALMEELKLEFIFRGKVNLILKNKTICQIFPYPHLTLL